MNYNDIIVRDYFGEDAGIKRQSSARSVDIIPYGQDILTVEEAENKYEEMLYDAQHAVISGKQCNCYVRGKNISSNRASAGTVKLYLMPFHVFTYPWQWRQLFVFDYDTNKWVKEISMVAKNGKKEILPGQVCLNQSAFIIDDDPKLIEGGHYCLCAVVNTKYHPVDIPKRFDNNLDVDRWVLSNPNVALLNIYPIGGNASYADYSFKYGSCSDKEENFYLKIKFYADYKNGERWSEDTKIRVECTDARYPFSQKFFMPQYNANAIPSITVALDNVPPKVYLMCMLYLENEKEAVMPAHGVIQAEYMMEENKIPEGYEDLKDHFHKLPQKEGEKQTKYLIKLGECFAYQKGMSAKELRKMLAVCKMQNT